MTFNGKQGACQTRDPVHQLAKRAPPTAEMHGNPIRVSLDGAVQRLCQVHACLRGPVKHGEMPRETFSN